MKRNRNLMPRLVAAAARDIVVVALLLIGWLGAIIAGGAGPVADAAIAVCAAHGLLSSATVLAARSAWWRLIEATVAISAPAAILILQHQQGAWLAGWIALTVAVVMAHIEQTVAARVAIWLSFAGAVTDLVTYTTSMLRTPPPGVATAFGATSMTAIVLLVALAFAVPVMARRDGNGGGA